MKYTLNVLINLPLKETLDKMNSLENLKKWQKELIEAKVISGNFGEKGAQTRLKYNFGRRKMTLIETIVETNMPHKLVAEYTTKGVYTIQYNYFTATEDGKTIWKSESEFTFKSVGMKIVGFIMPAAFKKQTLTYMQDFKKFAENQ